jgi:flagellar export protein FliJ
MSTSEGKPDAGMRAVARVRGVREQDSRLGLQQAVAEERDAVRTLTLLEDRLAAADDGTGGDLATFLAVRVGHQALAADIARSRMAVAAARTVSASAREHWQRDKTRLSAVELLLERRAEERRAERARREARELDDVVAQRWLRRRTTGGDG